MLKRTATKILSSALAALMLAASLALPARAEISRYGGETTAPPPEITAQAAMIVNLDTGEVMYGKNVNDKMFPGPVVKIMSAVVALEALGGVTEEAVTATGRAVGLTAGNNIGILSGEIFTARQLLLAMTVNSANDAANVLAEHISGTVDGFVAAMNRKAQELGCTSTVYTNPTGLHSPTMTTTAADVAKIAAYAAKLPDYLELTSTTRFAIPPTNRTATERSLHNRNHFVSKEYETQYYYPAARGMNAGSTAEAGYCLVTTAEHKGMRYLCVILKATDYKIPGSDFLRVNSFLDAKALLDWAFSLFANKAVVKTTDLICEPKITMGADKDFVGLNPDADIEALLPVDVDIETEVERAYILFDDLLVAPIKKGDVLGEIYASYDGRVLGRANLVANADVERSNILFGLGRIREMLASRQLIATLCAFVVLTAVYTVYAIFRGGGRRRRERFRL